MSFLGDIDNFEDKAFNKADKVIRKTALDIYSRIVLRTPVDTGRAQNNWFVGIDSAKVKTTEETNESEMAIIADAQAEISQADAEDTIYITNNLSYILGLEHGRSDQSPQGMVKLTVAEFRNIVNISVEDF